MTENETGRDAAKVFFEARERYIAACLVDFDARQSRRGSMNMFNTICLAIVTIDVIVYLMHLVS